MGERTSCGAITGEDIETEYTPQPRWSTDSFSIDDGQLRHSSVPEMLPLPWGGSQLAILNLQEEWEYASTLPKNREFVTDLIWDLPKWISPYISTCLKPSKV